MTSTIKIKEVQSINPETKVLISYVGQSKCPVLQLDDSYLAPRKGCMFQVSQTEDGEWDLGASEVIGLGNVVRAFSTYEKPMNGFSAFSSNSEPVKIIFRTLAKEAMTNAQIEISYTHQDTFNQFIEECITWVEEIIRGR